MASRRVVKHLRCQLGYAKWRQGALPIGLACSQQIKYLYQKQVHYLAGVFNIKLLRHAPSLHI